jgi:hypothetical protein
MGYEIRLTFQDIIQAGEAAQMSVYQRDWNHKSRQNMKVLDWNAMLYGWMGQLAVGKYHYGDDSYDIREWVLKYDDLPDGAEVRVSMKKILWIKEYDAPDQMYWMIYPIEENRLWLMGSVCRSQVDHLKKRYKDTERFTVSFVDYKRYLIDVHAPMQGIRMLA